MGNNWQGIKKFVRQENSVVDYYVDCIGDHNVRMEELRTEKRTEETEEPAGWKFWK